MSTTNSTVTKWELPIPVRLSSNGRHDLERWALEHYASKVSPWLFTELSFPGPYMQLTVGVSECTVGRAVINGPQTVLYSIANRTDEQIKRTLLHELGHGIGLAHEHYHSQFPWDVPNTRDPALNPRAQQCTPRTWALYSNATLHYQVHLVRISQTRLQHLCRDLTPYCDLASIMMYEAYQGIIFNNLAQFPATPQFRNVPPQRVELAPSDAEGIRSLYGMDFVAAEIKVRSERSRIAVEDAMNRAAATV